MTIHNLEELNIRGMLQQGDRLTFDMGTNKLPYEYEVTNRYLKGRSCNNEDIFFELDIGTRDKIRDFTTEATGVQPEMSSDTPYFPNTGNMAYAVLTNLAKALYRKKENQVPLTAKNILLGLIK